MERLHFYLGNVLDMPAARLSHDVLFMFDWAMTSEESRLFMEPLAAKLRDADFQLFISTRPYYAEHFRVLCKATLPATGGERPTFYFYAKQ